VTPEAQVDRPLDEVLREIDRPIGKLPVHGGRLAGRLLATPALHRLLPAPAALAALRLVLRARWRRDAARRAHGEHLARLIVSHTEREADANALAPRLYEEEEMRGELLMRPWLGRRIEVSGEEHFRRCVAAGRGTIVSFPHLGPWWGLAVALGRIAGRTYMLGAPHTVREHPTGYRGRAAQRIRLWMEEADARLIDARKSSPIVAELLRRGQAVAIGFDLPGSRQVELLGKRVMVASGTVWLARDTGAMVLPVYTERSGHRTRVRITEPLDPSSYETPEAMWAALASRIEGFVLADPAAWGTHLDVTWGGGAGLDAWERPSE
jgi:lauroyl/myristoyl acyltransferase